MWPSLRPLDMSRPTFVVETNLHALLHDLADRDQILRDGEYMQDILMQVWSPSFQNGTLPKVVGIADKMSQKSED
mgnify:CR=1 FL=1